MDVGNALLRILLLLTLVCQITNTSALLQHPAPPEWCPQVPS